MKLIPGVSFNQPEPAVRVAEYIEIAEKEGFKSAFMTDSQLIWRELWVCMTLALLRTKSIRIGTGVTNPVTRNSSVTASAAATLDELAPGRVILGIGVGDSSVNTLHRRPATLAELRSSVQTIRALLRGEQASIDGTKVKMPWANCRVPVVIASTGPKSLRLAGELADGVIINVGAHSDLVNWALEHLEAGARKGGRSLRDLDIWVRVSCYPSAVPADAREAMKGVAAAKANGLARYGKEASFRRHLSPALLADIENLSQSYNYYEHENPTASHARLVTDRILETLVIGGTPSYCAERLREIIKQTGLNQFSFATYGFPNIPAFMKRFMQDVAHPLQ